MTEFGDQPKPYIGINHQNPFIQLGFERDSYLYVLCAVAGIVEWCELLLQVGEA